MENEYEILNQLEKDNNVSQRKIAKLTGLSLGMVNLLLKKMVCKGLVKIERLNAKTLRYIITPQGISEKTRLAYQYMKISYNRIMEISTALKRSVKERDDVKRIVIYGPNDEIMEILKIAAANLGIKYKTVSTREELTSYMTETDSFVSKETMVVTWTNGDSNEIQKEFAWVNILSVL